jgi:hypothetical protein
MKDYVCSRCHYTTCYKANYVRHLQNKKACQAIYSNESVDSLLDIVNVDTSCDTKCPWCNKTFSSPSNLTRHKHKCKYNKYTNSKEDNITNNFLKEDLTYINDEDYVSCYRRLDNGLVDLIKRIYFNENHKENHNIYIHRIKAKTLCVYKNDKWTVCDTKSTINEVIVYYARVLYKMLISHSCQEKIIDVDSVEHKIASWLLSLTPSNEKAMGSLSRRIYAMLIDHHHLSRHL